jgi:hypothetical protein
MINPAPVLLPLFLSRIGFLSTQTRTLVLLFVRALPGGSPDGLHPEIQLCSLRANFDAKIGVCQGIYC